MAPALRRVCLLTGAGGRLGRAFCARHADKYDIVAVYRRHPPEVPSQQFRLVDPLEPDATLPDNAHPVFCVQADLADDASIDRIVEIALARHDRIDVIVNAAVEYPFHPIMDRERYFEALDLHLRFALRVPLMLAASAAQRFWRDRRRENIAERRHVLNISSLSGLVVYPDLKQSAYSAAKAAMNMATAHLAQEFRAIGVRANVLAPDSFPGKLRPDSVADMIARLDQSDVNGQIIRFDAADAAAAQSRAAAGA